MVLLLNPEFSNWASLARKLVTGSPISTLSVLELQGGHHPHLAFPRAPRIQTLVATLSQQALYLLSHLPSPLYLPYISFAFWPYTAITSCPPSEPFPPTVTKGPPSPRVHLTDRPSRYGVNTASQSSHTHPPLLSARLDTFWKQMPTCESDSTPSHTNMD